MTDILNFFFSIFQATAEGVKFFLLRFPIILCLLKSVFQFYISLTVLNGAASTLNWRYVDKK